MPTILFLGGLQAEPALVRAFAQSTNATITGSSGSPGIMA